MINISIIMPLYNAEKYLEETLQSVLKQTHKNFELICIDDASNDTTIEILQSFQQQDNRIRIISNSERMGAAASRNKGIKATNGEYITFLDGDDIFEEEMLELAYNAAKKNDVDIVVYEYKHMPSDKIYNKQFCERSPQFIQKYCKNPFSIRDYLPIDFLNWTGTPWNKIYRKEFIISKQLEFQSLTSSNDVFFVEMALILANRIIMLDDRRVMVYARDHFEPSRISYDRDPMCAYLAVEKIGRELEIRGLFETYSEYYYCLLFPYFRNALIATKTEEKCKGFYEFLKTEGVRALLDINRECFEKTDAYIKKLLAQFEKQEYFTKWYRDITLLTYYLEKEEKTVKTLFETYKEHGVRTVLWGAGVKGKALLEFLETRDLNVSEVVDKDKRKHGNRMCGYIVKSPEEIWNVAQVIIVTSHSIYNELLPIAEEKKIELVNIEEVVRRD